MTDAELLDQFVSRRDEFADAAFEELANRQGPMVLRVCLGVLTDPHDAEDAFQAVFLVLASRAGSIKHSRSVASWLFGVAQRVATRARRSLARYRRLNQFVAEHLPRSEPPREVDPDLEILHEEIDALPARLRAPVVLCYLEGLTCAAAAHHLGISDPTVRGRLARARERLRRRLIRRGVTVPAGLLVAGAATQVQAALSLSLIQSTVRVASGFLAGNAAILARGVLKLMLFNQLKTAAMLACLGIATLFWAWQAAAVTSFEKGQSTRAPNAQPAPATAPAKAPPEPQKPAPITTPITVRGRATDQQGKPVAGATIYLVSTNGIDSPLGTATTDRDGAYVFRNARLPVSRHKPDDPLAGTFQIYGTAPAYGFAWHGMRHYQPRRRPDEWYVVGGDYTLFGSDPKVMDLRFPPAATLDGSIRDEKGGPIADVKVRISHCDMLDTAGKESHHNFREFWAIQASPPALTTTKTDREGRFSLKALPSEAGFWIHLNHPDYAWRGLYAATTSRPTTAFDYPRQSTVGNTRPPVTTGSIEVTLHSTRRIAARTVFADSGRPAPKVRLNASQGSGAAGNGAFGTTDDAGKLEFRLPPGDYDIVADPTDDTAEFVRTRSKLTVASVPIDQSLEVRVKRGCVVILEAVDAKTAKGIPGVGFMVDTDKAPGARMSVQSRTGYIDHPVTDANGRLRAVVNPGSAAFSLGVIPEAAGYKQVFTEKRVDLPAGQTVTVRFELEK
jgi:RNA polymerase sigma factor (sigma-70 family)